MAKVVAIAEISRTVAVNTIEDCKFNLFKLMLLRIYFEKVFIKKRRLMQNFPGSGPGRLLV